MSWVKGPRCGVDNCPSRFWRILEGTRVCQNGHVSEGWETAGDDDDYGAHGRRIRQPGRHNGLGASGARDSHESEKLHGHLAQNLYYECLQVVLRHQIDWIIAETGLPHHDVTAAARSFWACIVSKLRMPTHKSHGDVDTGMLMTLTSVAWLACLSVRAPIFIADFVRWIASWKLPYMESVRFLNTEQLRKLPDFYIKVFRPHKAPDQFGLHSQVRNVMTLLMRDFDCKFPQPPWNALVFRLVHDLLLPPTVYPAALRVLSIAEFDASWDSLTLGMRSRIPEVFVLCCVGVAVKLGFGLDGVSRREGVAGAEAAADHPDWDVWCDIMRKLYLMAPDPSKADERLVQYWDSQQIDKYIDWYQFYFGNEPRGITLSQQRLLSLFPIEDPPTDPPIIEGPDLDTYRELAELLYGVQPGCNESGDFPGSAYKVWNAQLVQSDAMLPKATHILYQVLGRFLGCSLDQVRMVMGTVERAVRNGNTPIYLELEESGELAWALPSRDLERHTRRKGPKQGDSKDLDIEADPLDMQQEEAISTDSDHE